MAEITIENYRRICPAIDDTVVFVLDGEKLVYRVTSSHFHGVNVSNDRVFGILEIHNKRDFCANAYQYSPASDGVFPPYKNNDLDAARRVIVALFRKIEERLPDQLITIDNYKSIPYIKLGDKIKFDVGGEIIDYKVCGCFLEESCFRNALIFSKLGLNKKFFCTNAYGYEAARGSFPESRNFDFEALHRVINALFDHMRGIAHDPTTDVEPKIKSNLTELKVESVKTPSLTTTFKIIL